MAVDLGDGGAVWAWRRLSPGPDGPPSQSPARTGRTPHEVSQEWTSALSAKNPSPITPGPRCAVWDVIHLFARVRWWAEGSSRLRGRWGMNGHRNAWPL